MTHDLATSAQHHASLRDALKAEYGLEDDDQTLIDTLNGASNFDELVESAALAADEAEEFCCAIEEMMERLRKRANRYSSKALRIRAAIKQAMLEAGVKKVTRPGATVYTSPGRPKLVYRITPEEAPDKFVKTERKFDAAAVRAALVSGDEDAQSVAHFSNSEPTLTIKAS